MSSLSPSTSALQKEFDELVNAMKNSQIPVFREILEGENGNELLYWNIRLDNKLMTPMMIACNYFEDGVTLREFFLLIRKIGGDKLLKRLITTNLNGLECRSNFHALLSRRCHAEVILCFLGTLIRLNKAYPEDYLLFKQLNSRFEDYQKSPLYFMVHCDDRFTNRMLYAQKIISYYLEKFGLLKEHSKKTNLPYSLVSIAELSEIEKFEQQVHEEGEQFVSQQRAIKQEIKQEVKEEEQEQEEEMDSRADLELKLQMMQREIEMGKRALANEKSAHEFTKEQLRLSLQQQQQLIHQQSGTRRQREENAEEEEAPAPAPKKAATRKASSKKAK